ncbi:diaminopimelate epimerase [Georgenia faecalis]|uniref:Diaminopimelate epimerase n=1 Tax=Georgenia faecalis TaxID=2483799 RepID=A0ABV9DC44_9MICO|nr:diaminopimelate epimerase [Georgenia faecalis]
MTTPALRGLRLTKGHGTENDFLLLTDPDGALVLDAADVAGLCDRRAGIGADGLIRAVRSRALPEGVDVLAEDSTAEWFMDYRNADGSVAEMCGNGIRVFVAYLEREGLVEPGAAVAVGTRSGVRRVWRTGEEYTVDMGPWRMPGGAAAIDQGYDVAVVVAGLAGARAGLRVDVPNPHTVVALPDVAELDAADLGPAVVVEPVPPAGTNVELVVPLGEEVLDGEAVGTVRMRVQERGVGETRSCGTGTCAAALAVRAWAGRGAPDAWRVLVPGGEVRVRVVDGDRVELTGPAVLVADVSLR